MNGLVKEDATELCNSAHRNSQSCNKYSLNTTGGLTHLERARGRKIQVLDSVSYVVTHWFLCCVRHQCDIQHPHTNALQ